jgi:predicted O-linked N-acetylglucosamine transferase (SPINDLY family)
MVLADLGRNNEAFYEYQAALRLLPDYSEALTGLGSLLVKNRRLEEAEEYLKQAIEINPEDNVAYTSIARVYLLQGRSAQACDYFKKAFELSPGFRSAADNLLYSMCYPDTLIPEEIAREHVVITSQLFSDQRKPRCSELRTVRTPLRLGYLSGDFCTHSVAFFLEPILIHHDRKHFSVYCYSNRRIQDQTTLRIKSLDVQWREIFDKSAEEVTEQIVADGIDILVDLSGHSSGNRLDVCALRPAPIQVTWLGYPHSTGMSQMDYYLSDHLCDPVGMTDHLYSEQVWRLPRIFCCYLPPMEFPAVAPAPFISNGVITFGSFNNFAKVTETVLSFWASILRCVPGSQLFLKSIGTESSTTQDALRTRFSRHGIAPDRIVFARFADDALQHLALYARIDISLDTYPYNGTTTTCESLWMGVPVITMAGSTHLSRVGASLLSSIGLKNLIAETPDQYCELAVELAFDPDRLLRLREELRSMMARSPLMDGPGVTKDVEESFILMSSAYQAEKGKHNGS